MSEVSQSPISVVAKKIQGMSLDDCSLSVGNENVFTVSKCSVIIHLFEFIVTVNKVNVKLDTTLWDKSFWSLLGL